MARPDNYLVPEQHYVRHHTLAIPFVNFYQVTANGDIYVIGRGPVDDPSSALVYAIKGKMKLLK